MNHVHARSALREQTAFAAPGTSVLALRNLTAADFTDIAAIYHDQLQTATRLLDAQSRDTLRRHIQGAFRRQMALGAPDSHGITLTLDGKVIGFGHISRAKAGRGNNMCTYRINALAVDAKHANHGFENMILGALENFAAAGRADRIVTFMADAPAGRREEFWRQAGYEAGDHGWQEFKARASGVFLRGVQLFKMTFTGPALEGC